ncbi:hypothetical protein LCGC14_0677600 [marine sediment metagenome]|uniref:Uncharacterized protein n=1 Tax=marine sediment metagenome TaxID=412755 RepID=A0A0F9TAK1_9ZZZZ
MQKYKWIGRHWLVASLLTAIPLISQSGSLENAIDSQVKTDVSAQQSQKKIDGLADETTQLLDEYRETLRQTESLRTYNDQLDKIVSSQQKELESITDQLRNIESTQRDIVPLMLKMIDTMVQFVALDLPFLPKERQARIVQLQSLMERADVSSLKNIVEFLKLIKLKQNMVVPLKLIVMI